MKEKSLLFRKLFVVLLTAIIITTVSPMFSVPVNAATNQLTFVDVNSRTYTTGTGKVTVLVLGRPTCGNCHATISGLSNADWINSNDVQIVFADIDGNATSVIQQFRDEINCNRIMFCAQEQSLVGNYNLLLRNSLSSSGNVTLPVIVYYDKQGNQIDVTTGRQTPDNVLQYAVKAGFESGLVNKPTGWMKDSKGWWYRNSDGSYSRSKWQQIGGSWYYFDGSGYAATGWKKIGNEWYFFDGNCAMVTGWKKLSGKWYYFKKSGAMAHGEYCEGYRINSDGTWTYPYKCSWKKDSKGWWYGNSKWYARSCSIKIDGKLYTFDGDGYCKNP